MALSGYFMSKSVFGQQGCRALTFALARLSCYNSLLLVTATTVIIIHYKDTEVQRECQGQDQGLIYEIASRPYQGLPP